MKFRTLLVASLAIIAFSCNKTASTPPSNSANVNFVNGCVSGTATLNIDPEVNNKAVTGTGNIAVLHNSGYVYVSAGSNQLITMAVHGLGTTLCSGASTLSIDSSYTVFAGGSITSPSFLVTMNNLSAPATGYAKIRFVNLSPDSLNETCYIGTGSTALASNVGFNTATSYFEVAAGTANVIMLPSNKPTEIPGTLSQNFAAGKIYTVMLTGTAAGIGNAALTYTIINDN